MTVNELDEIVALTLEDQQLVYGSHLSGGGFGGCIVTLLHKDAVEDAKLRIMVRAVSLELSLSLFSLYPSLFLSLLPLSFSLSLSSSLSLDPFPSSSLLSCAHPHSVLLSVIVFSFSAKIQVP